jgi:cobalamin biosynthesis protein CobT
VPGWAAAVACTLQVDEIPKRTARAQAAEMRLFAIAVSLRFTRHTALTHAEIAAKTGTCKFVHRKNVLNGREMGR